MEDQVYISYSSFLSSKSNYISFQFSFHLLSLIFQSHLGSFFFISDDGQFILKTITRNESFLLMDILKDYYEFMILNPHSLLTRYLGLYNIRYEMVD